MAKDLWKIQVNLRKTGNTVFTLTTRTQSGDVLRSNRVIMDRKGISSLVDDHIQAVKVYDVSLHDRVHQLANQAAKVEADE